MFSWSVGRVAIHIYLRKLKPTKLFMSRFINLTSSVIFLCTTAGKFRNDVYNSFIFLLTFFKLGLNFY